MPPFSTCTRCACTHLIIFKVNIITSPMASRSLLTSFSRCYQHQISCGATPACARTSLNRSVRRCSSKPESNIPENSKNSAKVNSARSFGPDARKGPMTWAGLGIIALIGTGTLYYYEIEKKKRMEKVYKNVAVTGKPDLGGPFVLVNHHGLPVTDASYRGKYVLLYFGFSFCPDICPAELVKVKAACPC